MTTVIKSSRRLDAASLFAVKLYQTGGSRGLQAHIPIRFRHDFWDRKSVLVSLGQRDDGLDTVGILVTIANGRIWNSDTSNGRWVLGSSGSIDKMRR